MTNDELQRRIEHLCVQDDPQLVFTGALTVMGSVYGPESLQVRALIKVQHDLQVHTNMGVVWQGEELARAARGALTNLSQELQTGLLTTLERRVAADVLSDLIQLAREALNHPSDGAKNVAAVLAGAAFEDTIRRIAREHAGVIGQDKLEAVLGKLKDAGLLVAPQVGIAQSYLSFRNHALHANWDKVERGSVESVLAFVEWLLLKHFSS